MSDNTTLEGTLNSSGDKIHTDELTAATYKMACSKIIFGTSGNNDAYWAAGAGANGSGVGRVTLATDDAAVVALQLIDNAVSGAGFNITQLAGAAVPIGAGTEAAAVRVTLPTDGTGVVTANLSAVDNAVLDSMVTLLTTIDADTDSIKTAVELLDNIVSVEDAVHNSGDSGVMALAVRNDTLSTLAGADGDYAPLQVDEDGLLWVRATTTPRVLIADGVSPTIAVSNNHGAFHSIMRAYDGVDYERVQSTSGAVHISDAGGSITVDNGGTFATQATLQSNSGVVIGDVNLGATDNAVLDTIATNTTVYTEDIAAAADPVGPATILVRDDTPGALTSTDGDNVAQRGTNFGAAFCQILDSSGNFIDSFGGSGGTSAADDADFVAGTTLGTAAMGVYESSPTSVTDGDLGVVGIDVNRRMMVSIEVDNVGIGGGTQYTEDAAAAADPIGGAVILVREDARAGSLTSLDGDNVAQRGNNNGEAYVIDTDAVALLTTIDADTSKIVACDTGAVVIASGAVTATLSATDNAVLDTIDAVLDTINAKLVTGTVIGDVNLGATDNAVLDTIATNTTDGATETTLAAIAGYLDTEIAAILTAVQILDNFVAGSEAQVDVITSALPTGASTEATLSTLNGKVTACNTGAVVISSGAVTATLSATDNAVLDTIDAVLDTINAKLVTGTVIGDVNLGATDNAVLDQIVTNTTGLAGTVSGSEQQVDVVAALPAGANTIGGTTAVASAAGGMSFTMLGLAAADNDVVIKASAATIYYISIQSLDATPVYLKLFNLASFTPGTSTADLQFMCPANATPAEGAGIVLNFGTQGIEFGTGLCALIATGIALDDNTAVSANEVVVTIGWK